MPYDTKAYGQSPFGAPVKGSSAKVTPAEPLSDLTSPSAEPADESTETDGLPPLPSGYAATAKPRALRPSLLYLPRGALTGMSILGEAALWLMAWGTVGFFRSYVPPAALTVCDRLFSPWGMSALTFFSALTLGRSLHRHALKLAAVRDMATTAIEHGEAHHQADAQNSIYDLLSSAKADSERLSGWVVSHLTAIAALFIIGAFY